MKILDLGCGENKITNSIGVDNVKLPSVDVIHDLLDMPYPFEDESIDKIYLRHVIEHFTIENINTIINECFRMLKKDSLLVITVPHVSSISAFIDPTHQSFFTFGSGQFWDKDNPKIYYKDFESNLRLVKTSCRVTWFNWKSYRLKKIDKLLSRIMEIRIARALSKNQNLGLGDRIIKKYVFHFVEIKWTFQKL